MLSFKHMNASEKESEVALKVQTTPAYLDILNVILPKFLEHKHIEPHASFQVNQANVLVGRMRT